MCNAISSHEGPICKNTENKEAHTNSVVYKVLQESLH